MRQHTTSVWAAGLIAATLALPGAFAANLGDIAGEHVFFSTGGPAKGSSRTRAPATLSQEQTIVPAMQPATLPDANTFTQTLTPDEQVREHPIGRPGVTQGGPDPSLFTQVSHPGEQTIDHAFDLFGLLKKPAKSAAPATNPDGQLATPTAPSTAQPPEAGTPDPSLFTEVPHPGEQTRDHPFTLF